MAHSIPAGLTVTVSVPASTANIGPGFDSLGMALELRDEILVSTIDSGLEIEVQGEGAGELPRTAHHLVVRAIERALAAMDFATPGLKIVCRNVIPHSRGLGSSAAAAVAGVAAAVGLVAKTEPELALSLDQQLQLAAEFEGHPDNAAASVYGGVTVSWTEGASTYRAVRLEPHADLRVHVLVPSDRSSTSQTRRALPVEVPHRDAAFNVSRTALSVVALTARPEFLLSASEDRLHQSQRAEALPVTTEWVARFRERGCAAMVSGAGPTVLILSIQDLPTDLVGAAQAAGLRVLRLDVAEGVRVQ